MGAIDAFVRGAGAARVATAREEMARVLAMIRDAAEAADVAAAAERVWLGIRG
ncbi:MAG: hypothetical protein KIT52_10440 [Anaerolineae bacterium]|nr:hypothetical protein [Anaerolineae bacterium]